LGRGLTSRPAPTRARAGTRMHMLKRCGDRGGNGPELALHQPSAGEVIHPWICRVRLK